MWLDTKLKNSGVVHFGTRVNQMLKRFKISYYIIPFLHRQNRMLINNTIICKTTMPIANGIVTILRFVIIK